MKSIYTIIIAFNGKDWIEKCIKSLLASNMGTEIIVIDNNSLDNTVEIVKKHRGVTLIENSKNLGFGAANNIGIALAMKKGADYIFLLNQDTQIFPSAIKEMIKVSEKNNADIVCPIQLDSPGESLDLSFSSYALQNSKIFSDIFLDKIKDAYELSFMNAAAWFVAANCFRDVGGFDPIFFHYGEDEDFCYRMKYKKMKLYLSTKSVIKHHHAYDKIKEKGIKYLFKKRFREFVVEIKNVNYSFARVFADEYFDLFLSIIRNFIRPHRYKNLFSDILVFIFVLPYIPRVFKSRFFSKHSRSPFLDLK